MHHANIFTEPKRRQTQNAVDDVVAGREPTPPTTILSLLRDEGAAKLMLTALYDEYFHCMASGRLDVWAKAAHSTIDLLATQPHGRPLIRRSELEAVIALEQASNTRRD